MSNHTDLCESCGKEISDSTLFEVPLRAETRSLIRKRRLFISHRDDSVENHLSNSTSDDKSELMPLIQAISRPSIENCPPNTSSTSAPPASAEAKGTSEQSTKQCDEASRTPGVHPGGGGVAQRMLSSRFLRERGRRATAGAARAEDEGDEDGNGGGLQVTRWHEGCLKCDCCDALIGELGSCVYERHGLLFCKRDYLRYANFNLTDRQTSHYCKRTVQL